jgi:UDP-glucose 4-epimerase
LLPFVTQTAIGLRKQLSVFGDDYNTPDGSCIRDYIHVVDLAKAHVIAVQRMLGGKNKSNCETFNLGTGRGLSVLEILETFKSVNQIDVPYKIVGRREGDVEKVWADPAYANNELGWVATETVEETLRSAWAWELNLAKQREAKAE